MLVRLVAQGKSLLPLSIWVLLISLSACANLSSVHHAFRAGKGESGVLIDAKQRAILVHADNGRVCAEPSPDALSAFAAALSAGAGGSAKSAQGDSAAASAQGSFGSSETAAYIGLRTTSIQLLRDQGYRLCESYLNEAIDSAAYALAMRRHQRDVVAMMAIEELMQSLGATRAAAASPVALPPAAVAVSASQDALITPPSGASQPVTAANATTAGAPKTAAAPIAQPVSPTIAPLPMPVPQTPSGLDVSVQQRIVGVVEALARGLVYADDLPPLCFDYLRQNSTSGDAQQIPLVKICTDALRRDIALNVAPGAAVDSKQHLASATSNPDPMRTTAQPAMPTIVMAEPAPVLYAPPAVMSAAPPPRAMPEIRVSTDVPFDKESDQLTSENKARLDDFLRTVLPEPSTKVHIIVIGHSDGTGRSASRRDLSRRRAQSVASYFLAKGFSAAAITVDARGAQDRVSSQQTASDREEIHGVEVLLKGAL